MPLRFEIRIIGGALVNVPAPKRKAADQEPCGEQACSVAAR